MASTNTDQIEKKAVLRAPVARVWRAIADAREFGAWFRAELEGDFVPGRWIAGRITSAGYEHLQFEALVETVEPERRLVFRWHPGATAPESRDAPTTRVEFLLEAHPEGTLLTIVESGFDASPADQRMNAFRENEQGWTEQMQNVERHVAGR